MTLADATPKAQYTGNASTTEFSFPHKVLAATHIVIKRLVISTNVESTVPTSEYSVSGVGETAGITVTFTTAPTTDHKLTILYNVPFEQQADYVSGSGFPADDHETAMDKFAMMLQQIRELASRVFVVAPSASPSIDLSFPTPEAGKVIGWNSGETGLENKALTVTDTQYAGTISYGTEANLPASPGSGDVYFATDVKITYRCYSAGTWSKVFSGIFDGIEGADIASASSIDLGAATGNSVTITGTTTITALGTADAGIARKTTFSGALTLTHNASSLILPGGANITTAAGDTACFLSLGSGNWRCMWYQKASGEPIVNKSNSNYVIEGLSSGRNVLRKVELLLEPGSTPGTNMNITHVTTNGVNFNEPSISNASDLASGGSSGSFALQSGAVVLAISLTETVLAVLNAAVSIHDVNDSSVTAGDIWFVRGTVASGDLRLSPFKAGTQSAGTSWLGLTQSGDAMRIELLFITSD